MLEIQEHIRSCQAGMSLTHLMLSLCSCISAFLLQTGRIGTVYHSPVYHPELGCAHQLQYYYEVIGAAIRKTLIQQDLGGGSHFPSLLHLSVFSRDSKIGFDAWSTAERRAMSDN